MCLISIATEIRRDTPVTETASGPASLWWSSLVSDFAVLPAVQLPAGVYYGVSFSTFAIDVPKYLQYLRNNIEKLGGEFIRSRLPVAGGLSCAIETAEQIVGDQASAFVNATGIGAKDLVPDKSVSVIRGQTVLVSGEAKCIVTRLGQSKNDIQAIIPRPGSGTTIVGVTREPDVWDTAINSEATRQLLATGRSLAPELLGEDGEFGVLAVQVGLRPTREGGPRVELEVLDGKLVIHEYGHSGAG